MGAHQRRIEAQAPAQLDRSFARLGGQQKNPPGLRAGRALADRRTRKGAPKIVRPGGSEYAREARVRWLHPPCILSPSASVAASTDHRPFLHFAVPHGNGDAAAGVGRAYVF
jgi:hypothetical protein